MNVRRTLGSTMTSSNVGWGDWQVVRYIAMPLFDASVVGQTSSMLASMQQLFKVRIMYTNNER